MSGSSSDEHSASRGSHAGLPGPAGGVASGAPSSAEPPPACKLVTAAEASRLMGEPMQTLAPQTSHDCNYWNDATTPIDGLAVGWSTAEVLPLFRQQLENDVPVHDASVLGEGAFSYPTTSHATGPGSREWRAAAARFIYDGYAYFVTVGRTDGLSHPTDPSGDEQLALSVAEQLLTDLRSGAVSEG
jgi:hypothetical protein